nr:hypothetical protein [Dubosiella newyorkensis]
MTFYHLNFQRFKGCTINTKSNPTQVRHPSSIMRCPSENGDRMRKKQGKSPARRRIKRGLYRSDTDRLINADINAALQILKKVVPTAYANGIEGIGLSPVKLNLSF